MVKIDLWRAKRWVSRMSLVLRYTVEQAEWRRTWKLTWRSNPARLCQTAKPWRSWRVERRVPRLLANSGAPGVETTFEKRGFAI